MLALLRAALFLVVSLAAFIFFAPAPPGVAAVEAFPRADMAVHAALFAAIGLLLPRAFPSARLRTLLPILLAGCASTELVQLALPARDASLLDLAANLVGSLAVFLPRSGLRPTFQKG